MQQNLPTSYLRVTSHVRAGALALLVASSSNVLGATLTTEIYLGGSGPDISNAVTFDAAKNIYVASSSGSRNFPGIASGTFPGSLYKATMSCVVTKLDPTASSVLASFILPPPGVSSKIYFEGAKPSDVEWNDRDCNPTAIRVDAAGNIFVAGSTGIIHIEGDGNHVSANLTGTMMGFITKLDPAGKTLFSSVIGGYSNSSADGKNHYTGQKSKTFISTMALDPTGTAYVGGWSDSPSLPSTMGSLQTSVY